jgi:cobalamin biosynthesis protein CobD/CbiB
MRLSSVPPATVCSDASLRIAARDRGHHASPGAGRARTVGAAVVGIAFRGDPASVPRVGFLMLLVVALVGLKITSGP